MLNDEQAPIANRGWLLPPLLKPPYLFYAGWKPALPFGSTGNRQPNNKRRSLSHFRLEGNCPPMPFNHNGVCHSQPHTRSPANYFGSKEWVKYLVSDFLWNSSARI